MVGRVVTEENKVNESIFNEVKGTNKRAKSKGKCHFFLGNDIAVDLFVRTKKSQAVRKASRFPTAAGMRGKRRREIGTRPHRSGKKASPFPLAADGDDIGSGRCQ